MIYLIVNEGAAERAGIPQYLVFNYNAGAYERIPRTLRLVADQIFSFEHGRTFYYKNRFGDDYQFKEDEKIVLKLKAHQL